MNRGRTGNSAAPSVCVCERVPCVCTRVCPQGFPGSVTPHAENTQRPSLFRVFPASGTGSGEAELVGGPLGHPETGIPVAPWGPLEQKPPPAQGQGSPGSCIFPRAEKCEPNSLPWLPGSDSQ